MIQMFILIFVALLVLLLSGNIVSLYVDWLWFQEIEQIPVFFITLTTQLKLGFILGLLFFLVMYGNLAWAHRYRLAAKWHRTEKWLDLTVRTQIDPHITKLIPILAIFIGFFVGLSGAVRWEDYLLFRNPSLFELSDPVFGNDFGFYLFQFPFLHYIQGWFMSMLVLVLLFTAALYIYHGGIGLAQKGVFFDSVPKRHLFLLVGLIVLTKAFGYRLSAYELLFTTRGIVTGAIYADVHARIPALNLLMVLAFLAALAIIVGGYTRGWRLPIGAVAALLIVSLLGGSLYPELLHRFRVEPNEIVLERPYILENIKATRFAYGLNNIEEKEFPAEEDLDLQDLIENDLTIKNIRLWDHRPLLSTYRQLQQIRTHYTFYRVSHIVPDTHQLLGVRDPIREGVTIYDPDKTACIGNNDIRVLIIF